MWLLRPSTCSTFTTSRSPSTKTQAFTAAQDQTQTQRPSTSPRRATSSSNNGAIAGGVVGGIIGLAFMCFVGFFVVTRIRMQPLSGEGGEPRTPDTAEVGPHELGGGTGADRPSMPIGNPSLPPLPGVDNPQRVVESAPARYSTFDGDRWTSVTGSPPPP